MSNESNKVGEVIVIAWLTRGMFDTHVGLTEAGRALPDGRYELRLVDPTPGTPTKDETPSK